MNKNSFLSLLVLVAFSLSSVPAQAQETKVKNQADAAVIGIVNLLEIQTKAKIFKDLRRQRDSYLSKYLEEAKKTENELKDRDQELLRQLPKMDEVEAREKSQKFKEDVMTFKHKNDVKRDSLNDAYMNSMTKVQFKRLAPIIQEVAVERGMNMVMNKTQFLHHKADLEITDEALRRLDERYPTFELPDPEKWAKKQ